MRIRNIGTSFGNFFHRGWPHLILALIVGILFLQNYVPNTWLTGWDNLHPEFDFKTNILDRSIWSTWQEYQGLGVRAGNAHATDLPRQVVLWLFSFFFQPSLLRYVYHFSMLYVGSLGVFELIYWIIKKQHHPIFLQSISLLGACFYVLNLGTMQYFSVPYEPFSHFFGMLPWLILSLFLYLRRPQNATFGLLAIANLLAIPMFYIPTIFVVYAGMIALILLAHIRTRHIIKLTITIIATIVCINAFWLLPFIAFIQNGTQFVSETKINRTFTEEAFLRNQKFGTMYDVALLKGFLFDTTDLTDTDGNHDFVMRPWIDYLQRPFIAPLFLLFFGLIAFGYFTLLYKGTAVEASLAGLWLIALVALFSDNPPIGSVFHWAQEVIPFFKQIFRFPFTKFLPLATLTYAIGLAFGLERLTKLLKTIRIHWLVYAAIPLAFGILLFINLPSFQGKLLYAPMRQTIPDEYFEVMKFFRTQPNGRIANLPQATFWGWTTYDWGYRGSGFPWYGIKQPILDRAFDVWNTTNEQYYAELTKALYLHATSQDLLDVAFKYDVSYIWIDERVILPHKPELLAIQDLHTRLRNDSRIQLVFANGKQSIYKVNTSTLMNSGITLSVAKNQFVPSWIPQEVSDSEIFTTTVPAGTLLFPSLQKLATTALAHTTVTPNKLLFSFTAPSFFVKDTITPLETQTLPLALPGFDPANEYIEANTTLLSHTSESRVSLTRSNNQLAIYPQKPVVTASIHSQLYQLPINNCIDYLPTEKTLFGKRQLIDNSIEVYGTDSHPCLYQRLLDLIPQLPDQGGRALIGFTLSYLPQATEQPRICLTMEGETACFFESSPEDHILNTDGTHTLNTLAAIGTIPLEKIWVKVEVPAERDDRSASVILGSLSAHLYTQPRYLYSFDLPSVGETHTINVDQPGSINLVFPKQSFLSYVIRPADFEKTKRNCYSLGKGNFDRLRLTDDIVGSFVRYNAEDASSCDTFPFTYPLLTTGGIASVTTRNVSGRPIKVCLKLDPPGHCVFEEIVPIPRDGNWHTASFLIPTTETKIPSQYFLEIDNYAVGKEKRINDIATISLTPLPIDWLSGVSFIPKDQSQRVTSVSSLQNGLVVRHPNPTYYVVTTDSLPPDATVVLHQSYDPGWIAWTGKTLLPHVLVNNWANGWKLAPKHTGTIHIFFLPQILQWIGFVLLIIPFLPIFFSTSRSNNDSR